jgi:tetratricopeptide (TPR) repeat protein
LTRFRSLFLYQLLSLTTMHVAFGQRSALSSSSPSALLRNHHYAEVLSQTDGLSSSQQDAPLWVVRGLAYRGLRRTAESLESFKHALSVQPDNKVALRGAAEAAFSLNDPATKTYVKEILALEPSDPVANAMAGSLAYFADDCDHAIKFFTVAQPVLDGNTIGRLQLSYCLVANGEPSKAVTVLTQVRADDPANVVSLDLAGALFYADRFQESLATLRQMRQHDVDTPEMWNLMGANYDKLSRVPEALNAYRTACEKAPLNAGYYIDLARFAMEHSSSDAAIKVLDASILRIPTSAELLTVRGSIYSFLGNSTLAEADFDTAARVDPESGFGRVGKSLLLSDRGDLRQAEQILREAMKRKPEDVEVKYFLGQALLKHPTAGANEEAAGLLRNVLKVRPNDPNVLLALSKALTTLHRDPEALSLLEKARALDPNSPAILNRLLQAYRNSGQREESAVLAAQLRSLIDRNRDLDLRRDRFKITANEK